MITYVKFCEEFKSSNSSVSVSLELLRRPDNSSNIKHFALHALDFFIRYVLFITFGFNDFDFNNIWIPIGIGGIPLQ